MSRPHGVVIDSSGDIIVTEIRCRKC
ncbi:hypothetical protein [Clostridium beijerinckii]